MTILHDPLCKKQPSAASEYAVERELCLKYFEQWPEKDQVLFVESLLARMCDFQQGEVNSCLASMLQRDFISLLAKRGLDHVAEKILSYLDTKSLREAEQVNKCWKRVIANGLLWKKLTESQVLANPIWRGLAEKKGWIKHLFKREPAHLHSYFSYKIFPMVQREIEMIENNWKTGNFHLQRLDCQSEHSKGVYCLQYDNDKIISGLRDNTIKVWDKNTLQCTRTISGHTGSILCLQYDDNIIVSGSSDHTIRVWDSSTGEMLNALFYHNEPVLHLRFRHGVLVTCSKDKKIGVWDMVSPSDIALRRVLVGHRAAVNVVDLDKEFIVSASGDRTIKLWHTNSGEFVRTITGHSRGIACLQYRDNLIVSGSSDLSIRLWNIYGTCLRVLEGHQSLVRCVRFDDKRIVSGDYNGVIKVWDLTAALKPECMASSICLQTLRRHTSRVFRIQFDKFQLVSSSHDDTILIWDFLKSKESVSEEEGNVEKLDDDDDDIDDESSRPNFSY